MNIIIRNILSIVCLMAVLLSANNKTAGTLLATVTIHADDAPLSTILTMLAGESGYNIVTGPNVNREEKLSIHLDDVPIDQAINLAVRASGLSYEIVGKSILVANHSNIEEDVGITPHVITLKYANPDEVKGLLQNITNQITIEKSGSNLLISASPKKIAEIEAIVKEIDVPATQIMLEARLIEVSVADDQEMGLDWAKLANLTMIITETGAAQLLPDGSESGVWYPGMDYNLKDDGSYEEIVQALANGQLPEKMNFNTLSSNPFPFSQGGARQLNAFEVTLDYLLRSNKAEILANSQVVTLNGHEAEISMVDVIPYILESGGVGGQVKVQKEEVGIKLKILPTVNKDGFITTSVIPEVSSVYDLLGPDRNIPHVKKRVSNTTIRVKDGETIIIAGLLSATRRMEKSKFPILWRIPWFGEKLFTHNYESIQKTDLIIQITPKIVQDNYSGITRNINHQQTNFDLKEKDMLEFNEKNLGDELEEVINKSDGNKKLQKGLINKDSE